MRPHESATADKLDFLHGQFIVTNDQSVCPAEWPRRVISNWTLAAHCTLPVAMIESADGTSIGWLLGYAISATGEYLPERITLNAYSTRDLESTLYEICGRWVAILPGINNPRIYLDAAGSLGMVYSTESCIAASTPTLLPEAGHSPDRELNELLNLPRKNLWYPSGLTSRRNVLRILPNHYLDLTSWRPVRHHMILPVTPSSTASMREQIQHMAERTSRIIKAVAKKEPILLPLTAGEDSRMLLACARDVVDRVHSFTFNTFETKKIKDVMVAAALAKRFGINHSVLEACPITQEQLEDWIYLTGGCAGGEISRLYQLLGEMDPSQTLMPGSLGELWRAYYSLSNYGENLASVDAAELIKRARLPYHPRIVDYTSRWLSELEGFSPEQIADIFYLEQEGGCWASPQHYGSDRYINHHLMPLVDRQIIDTIMSLPVEAKRSKQITRDICELAWPELLQFPFNKLTMGMKSRLKLKNIFSLGYRALLNRAS